ncbi:MULTISPECIES: hypothetical protein [Enterococcus]|uniref:hypothetical protein n=1 Tax=Enterococcus TaxID=1350 RepID=UPI0021AF0BA8|nr:MULTISPECIES: hypothetical protein [Enterococcus]
MGSIGIEVREKDLETVSTKIKLLNSQIWYLEEGFAVKYCYLFERGEKVPVQVDRVGINTIYPKIRFVFDKKNNVIAERACAGARLRTTRENNWLSINKKGNTNRALYIYQLIEKIEDREHAKKMLDHYYAGKSSKRGN